MPQIAADSPDWMTLSEAARYLGVHPTTLRRWSDAGELPVALTPGGHRRFMPHDLTQFATRRCRLRAVGGVEQLWADKALAQTRQSLAVLPPATWLSTLSESDREHKRQLGRRLLGLAMQYIAGEDPALLEEARTIGHAHAHNALQNGLALTEALQAALFFRDSLVEVALQMPEAANIEPQSNLRLLRRINALLNTVQLAVVEAFEKPLTA
ncbi:MAG: helix-turn-helix domain-containing protein [Chloroflexi bacterium]|nr:helix-turn-helix domain-containing protein [Chloroflexota bacterium]